MVELRLGSTGGGYGKIDDTKRFIPVIVNLGRGAGGAGHAENNGRKESRTGHPTAFEGGVTVNGGVCRHGPPRDNEFSIHAEISG
jgi:hypothetical protein